MEKIGRSSISISFPSPTLPTILFFPSTTPTSVIKGWPGRTTYYQAAPRRDEVDCKVHEMLAFQEWIWTRRKLMKRIFI